MARQVERMIRILGFRLRIEQRRQSGLLFFLSKFCDVGLCIVIIFKGKTSSPFLFGFRAAERRDSGSYSFTDLAQVGIVFSFFKIVFR